MVKYEEQVGTLRVTNSMTFEVEGKPYIFHGLSSIISELSPVGRDVVEQLQRETLSIEQLQEALPMWNRASLVEAVDELVKLEVITVDGKIGPLSATPPMPAHVETLPVQTFVLHLINECNLGCTYCYAGDGEYGAPMKAMNEETAAKALQFLFEASGRGTHVNVILFGGEPTMNWKLVEYIVEEGNRLAQQHGKSIDFSMTTNGTLLTKRKVDFITQHNIGVSISMDGDRETHDAQRMFKSGDGSFNIVERHATYLLSQPLKKPVAARVTLTKGFPHVKRTFEQLRDMGFHEVGFAPVSETDDLFILNDGELYRLLDEFEELAEQFVEHALRDEYYGFSNLVNILVELHTGANKSYGCGAGLGFYAVSPSGDLFLCHRFNEQEEYKMGDIHTGVNREYQRELLETLHVDNKTTCSRCPLKHTCSGGCYYEALERQGDIAAPNLHYCNWMYRWYSIGLQAYVRIMEQNPTYMDRVAQLAPVCAEN